MLIPRRRFGKLALAGALGARAGKVHPNPPGIKITVQLPPEASDEDLQFVKQLGAGWISMFGNARTATYENVLRVRQKVEAAGLRLWNFGNTSVHNMEEVTLNLPGRDQKIEQYKNYLRNIAKAGLHYTTYAHMANGIWSTADEFTRGRTPARAFDLAKADKGWWIDKTYPLPLTHGRVYSKQEIWDNYPYFIRQVAPLAEELGVRIGIHPDDPPVPELGGVPRCIFSSFEGYRKALEIAGSPNIGICLCVGCWLEGGKLMGKDPIETIQYFGKQGKIFKVHFRNVSAPLPHFVETYVDNGYMDMYRVMKALREVNFDGAVIPDHIPQMIGGARAGTAYSIAYMRAMLDRANAEVG